MLFPLAIFVFCITVLVRVGYLDNAHVRSRAVLYRWLPALKVIHDLTLEYRSVLRQGHALVLFYSSGPMLLDSPCLTTPVD